MTDKHENRRVRMTKSLIKNALLELLEEQDLTDITVTAVCDTADVHRSTFYKYYSDTSDLLEEIEQDYLNQIPKFLSGMTQKQLLIETTDFFDFVKQNEKAFRVLFGKTTGSSFAAHMVEVLCSEYIPISAEKDDLSAHFLQLYIANGTVGMLREWIYKKYPVSSQKIAEMMYHFSKELSC